MFHGSRGAVFSKKAPLAAGSKLIFLKNNKITVLEYGGVEEK
jgi:hypothetical protein